MAGSVGQLLLYILLPTGAIVGGGIAAAFWSPSKVTRSGIQHFAAGVVFAAVAVELLPGVMSKHAPLTVTLGFALGVVSMLAIKWATERAGQQGVQETAQPNALVATIGVDVLIDGLLVGVGFAAGGREGLLLTLALATEVLFLGLSTSTALRGAGATRGKVIGVSLAFGFFLAIGATAGVALLSVLVGSVSEAVLAFGAAVLLFVVVEELLVEAHEASGALIASTMFFVGFLLLLAVTMVSMPA